MSCRPQLYERQTTAMLARPCRRRASVAVAEHWNPIGGRHRCPVLCSDWRSRSNVWATGSDDEHAPILRGAANRRDACLRAIPNRGKVQRSIELFQFSPNIPVAPNQLYAMTMTDWMGAGVGTQQIPGADPPIRDRRGFSPLQLSAFHPTPPPSHRRVGRDALRATRSGAPSLDRPVPLG
jgi:hypothetical protein